MVAYSFKKQFIEPIRQGLVDPSSTGAKMQTIRSARKRHAREGERIQLYHGMRTRQCFKIIPDPICTFVDALDFVVEEHCIGSISRAGSAVSFSRLDAFAIADGFENLGAMHAFWLKEHGLGPFEGVLIGWNSLTSEVVTGLAAA